MSVRRTPRALAPAIADWLRFEQTVNDRIAHPEKHVALDDATHVLSEHRPERGESFELPFVSLPARDTRGYGFVGAALEKTLGLRAARGRQILFLHPSSSGLYRSEIARFGLTCDSGIRATPTASYRSLLSSSSLPRARPVIVKTSLDAVAGGRRRVLSEPEIACAVIVNRLLETVPRSHRAKLGFEWFPEPAGLAVAAKRHGWLLRTLPRALLASRQATRLVPAFSVISRRGPEPPLLVDQIRASGLPPLRFVAEKLILPYVNLLGYLLFEQGISLEAHTQNVLFEVSRDARELTGRLVLRDFSDASVNLALRLAKRRPLPPFAAGWLPKSAPFSILSAACDHFSNDRTPRAWRARQTVERHGLIGFLWPIQHVLKSFFPRAGVEKLTTWYLTLWQRMTAGYLGITPLIDHERQRIAVDEAIFEFLRLTDWSSRPNARLPRAAEPLITEQPRRRRAGACYSRIESAWGDLYLDRGEPAFYAPAS